MNECVKMHVKKIGRPKKINKDIIEKLNYAYSRGLTDSEACLYAGITKPTLYKYIEEHPEYAEIREVYKTNVGMHAKMNIAENIIDQKDIKISQYFLEKHDPDYSEKEVGNSNGKIEKLVEGLKDE